MNKRSIGKLVFTTSSDLGIIREVERFRVKIDNNVNEYWINNAEIDEII
jgi:hypothetical protein